MMIRLISPVILLMALFTRLDAQKNVHPVFGKEGNIIKTSCKVDVFLIDPIPVYSVEQLQNEEYIYDYRIMRKMEFKKRFATVLTDALLDTAQYILTATKTCPFMGTYAVKYKSGKRSLTVVISGDPCDKIIIFRSGSPIDKKHVDLKNHSTVLAAIRLLLNPVENKVPDTI